jgi:hypothetical protein
MSRSVRAALLVLGALVFLAITLVLTRGFAAASDERNAVVDLVRAEARGDAGAVTARLAGCDRQPGCPERTGAIVARLRRPGRFEVLRVDTSTNFALGSGGGVARIAWRAGGTRPVVQCVTVRRTGSVAGGLAVHPVRLSPAIRNDAGC